MPQVGDIVEVRRFPGQRWAVLGPHTHGLPPGRLWRVRSDGGERDNGRPQGRTVGDGDIIVLEHPQFEVDQVVTYHGREAMVLSDDGDTVRLLYQHLRPRNLDRQLSRYWRVRTVRVGEIDVGRGELVAENL